MATGRPDIAVANAGANNAALPRNTTAPGSSTVTFNATLTFNTGTNLRSIAAADLSGDGQPDLVAANSNVGPGPVSVLLNAQYLPAVVTSPATGTIVHDYVFADGFE